MNKQNSETIKIKINGKERPLSQAEEASDVIPVISWDDKLKAEKEVASAKQTLENEEEFTWLLPEENDEDFKADPKVVTSKKKMISNQSVTPYHYSYKKNRKQLIPTFPFKRFAIILVLAVGLGVIFGYVALNFLSNEDMPTAGTPSEVVKPLAEDNPSPTQTNDQAGASAASSSTIELYAVQGGIFSSKAGAESVAANIKNSGFASTVLETEGAYTVIAGIGKNKNETNDLNELYKENDFDDFWGGKQLTINISTSSSADQLASTILELSSLASATINGETINQDALSKIESTVKAINTGDDNEKQIIDKLTQAINFIKSKSGWEAQHELLQVMSTLSTK